MMFIAELLAIHKKLSIYIKIETMAEYTKKDLGIRDFDSDVSKLLKIASRINEERRTGVAETFRDFPTTSHQVLIVDENAETITAIDFYDLAYQFLNESKDNAIEFVYENFQEYLRTSVAREDYTNSVYPFQTFLMIYYIAKSEFFNHDKALIDRYREAGEFQQDVNYLAEHFREMKYTQQQTYINISTFLNQFQYELRSVQKQIVEDRKELDTYLAREKKILELERDSLYARNLQLSKFEPALKVYKVDLEMKTNRFEQIFDEIKLDDNVQYCCYRYFTEDNLTKNVFKLYQGKGMEKVPDFTSDWLRTNVEQSSIEFKSLINDVIITSVFYFNAQYLTVELPSKSDVKINEILGWLLPKLQAVVKDKPQLTRIKGSVKIKGINIIEPIMSYLFMNDEKYTDKFTFRETSLIMDTGRKVTYMFKPETHYYCDFTIHNVRSRTNETFTYPDKNRKIEKLEEGTKYLRIDLDANDILSVTELSAQLLRLVRFYPIDEKRILNYYRSLIDGFNESLYGMNDEVVSSRQSGIKELRKLTADELGKDYTRICQAKQQPKIIPENERAAFERETFTKDGVTYHRKTIVFPNTGPVQNIYGCKDTAGNGYDFINLIMKNGKFYPCCSNTDKTNDPNKGYKIYYEGAKEPDQEAQIEKSVNYILSSSKNAVKKLLPNNIVYILSKAYARHKNRNEDYKTLDDLEYEKLDRQNWSYLSFGYKPRSDGLLFPIFSVISNEFLMMTIAKKKEFVRDRVLEIINEVKQYPSILRQELPEFSDQEIIDFISDPSFNFDSFLVLPLLEKIYDVNIVVFTKTDDYPSGEIEIPRHKNFRLQNYFDPGKKTVLIYKDYKGEDDPQNALYHLIVKEVPGESKFITHPPEGFVDFMNDLLVEHNRSVSWYFNPIGNNIQMDPEFNLVVNLRYIFTDEIEEEYIDHTGHLRFVNYKGITCVTPISLPLGARSCGIGAIKRAPLDKIISLLASFKGPDSNDVGIYSISVVNNEVTGLWWYKSIPTIKSLFFTPCKPIKLERTMFIDEDYRDKINLLADPSIIPPAKTTTSDFSKLLRLKFLIFEIVKFIFLVDLHKTFRGKPRDYKFTKDDIARLKQYFKISPEGDNHTYHLEEITGVFPDEESYDTVQDALIALNAPSFVSNGGRLILPSADLVDKIISFLYIYFNNIRGKDTPIPTEIASFYKTLEVYKKHDHEIMFDNIEAASKWIENLNVVDMTSKVYKKVNESLEQTKTPYVFRYRNYYFLVQNVQDGSLRKALAVSYMWAKNATNIGYAPPDYNIPLEQQAPWKLVRTTKEGLPLEIKYYPTDFDGAEDQITQEHAYNFAAAIEQFPHLKSVETLTQVEGSLDPEVTFFILSYPGRQKYAAMLFLSSV